MLLWFPVVAAADLDPVADLVLAVDLVDFLAAVLDPDLAIVLDPVVQVDYLVAVLVLQMQQC